MSEPTESTARVQAVSTSRSEKIRALNDRLRTTGKFGSIMITHGVASVLDPLQLKPLMQALKDFDAFNADNDPHGEHDCAVLETLGHRFIWKIDYFDRAMEAHSPDAADDTVTRRVLTIMLAEEY